MCIRKLDVIKRGKYNETLSKKKVKKKNKKNMQFLQNCRRSYGVECVRNIAQARGFACEHADDKNGGDDEVGDRAQGRKRGMDRMRRRAKRNDIVCTRDVIRNCNEQ